MEAFNVRKGEVSDLDLILDLEAKSMPHPWAREDVLALLNSDNKMALIIGDYGYVGVSWVLDEAEIGNICVNPEMRRIGLARKLLEELISELRKLNMAQLFLEVDETNTGAIKLYESVGFEMYSRRKGYYGPADALLYRFIF